MGSFWKKAWQRSRSGRVSFFLVLGKEILGGRSLLNGGVEDIEKQTREEEEVGSENLFGGLHVCCSERQVGAHSSRSKNGIGWKQKKKRMGERR